MLSEVGRDGRYALHFVYLIDSQGVPCHLQDIVGSRLPSHSLVIRRVRPVGVPIDSHTVQNFNIVGGPLLPR